MKTAILALCLVVAFAMVPTATLAEHDPVECEITSSEGDVELEGIAIFIDQLDTEGYSVWVYQESNGIDGIQRTDDVAPDELCGHEGDTVIL